MDLKHSVSLAATFMASKKWTVSSFQQIEATMLDAQWLSPSNSQLLWEVDNLTTTSTDQHLQGYDRFNLHPHSLKCIKYRLYICIIISYMNKSPNTPPNRTLHQKLSCFIQFVELPHQNFIIKKTNQNQNHFWTTQTQIFPIFWVLPTTWPTPHAKILMQQPTSKSHSGFTSMHWANGAVESWWLRLEGIAGPLKT